MPAANEIKVNLLGQEQFTHAPLGRFVTWAMTYGRYIMISTEFVVLIAFLSRFSLDRQLTDLKDEISQKQDIIQANQTLESNFRMAQTELKKVKDIFATQSYPFDALNAIHVVLPQGTYLQSIAVDNNKINAQITSLTVQSFSQFLINVSATKQLTNVEIGTIDKKTTNGIQYTMTAQYVPTVTK